MKNSNDVFKVGNLNIGWLDSDFPIRFPNVNFESRTLGAFKILPRNMKDSEMLSEKLAEECELGDVVAFLENPPEGTKDGYSNIFIIKNTAFVVGVYWLDSRWHVGTWRRDDGTWFRGDRVFSPATTFGLSISLTLSPQAIRNLTPILKINISGKQEELILKSEVLALFGTPKSTKKTVKKSRTR